ncbi:MAG: proteasome accessory factor PafA2 [Ilumatobacter sp.]|jgi:proteasome accessory factor PafA2|uniref:depupylase/deamidase Dop n=2 Tax=Ilumatobacter sp. TaxID=1967498 RepID=UPI001D865F33|nr:proteasome accessory factor PafA2 [Ilumatobacter sp.]MBT5553615.1 proteasome accessory factor PafA2 [Ilumatobacter sp.]MDG0977143.1 depupylase/deamidase Dop [Ilumatobacter sp.]
MALPKVLGIETEYGIFVRGGDNNPVSASSLLINAYVAAQRQASRIGWDFEDEQPTTDARGFTMDEAIAPEVETTLVNAVLTNGARYYVDHAHPEISTPEVTDAREAVVWDRAADEIVRDSMAYARDLLDDSAEIIIHKNNSDGKGNSYGCHENYLVARELPFGRLTSQITPHFVTRQIFTGAGKVGCELPGRPNDDIGYQISQRADFFEEEVGLETTLKRPIVNTRDEPHADPLKYRRLHVIVGDANMSEVATYLKVGTTAIILSMIEDDELGDDWTLGNPVPAIRQVSHDPSLRQTIMLRNGNRATALEVQWGLFERAQKYVQARGLAAVGADVGADVMEKWEHVLTGLEHDPDSVAHWVDWVAKRRIVDGYSDRYDLKPGAQRLKAIDLQYHDMRADKCLALRAGLDTIVTDAEARAAMTEPPESTRAYFRGRCLEKFPDDIVAANWDSLVFDIGRDPLRRVPMMEPLRGTADHVGTLIDTSATARELLDRLGQ